MVKIRRRLSGYRKEGKSLDTIEAFKDAFLEHNDPIAKLDFLEADIDSWLAEKPAEEIEKELQRLSELIVQARDKLKSEEYSTFATIMFMIGECVGRMNHAEIWLEGIKGKIQRSNAGSVSTVSEELEERIINMGKRLKQSGNGDRYITGLVWEQLGPYPSRPKIREILRKGKIIEASRST